MSGTNGVRVTLYFRKTKKEQYKMDFYNVIHHVVSINAKDPHSTIMVSITFHDDLGVLHHETHSCVEVECINLKEIKKGKGVKNGNV